MTKPSATKVIVLSAAAQRANMLALPLLKNLKAAPQKLIAPLLKQDRLEEIDAYERIDEWCPHALDLLRRWRSALGVAA